MRQNNAYITRELCHSSRVVFYPKDVDEAIYIQKKLFEMGCRWARDGIEVANVAESVGKGLLCEKGTLYYNPDKEKPFVIATADQFDPDYLPPEQAYVRDRFNELSARIDDLAEKVNRIHDALFPDVDTTKPTLQKPRGAPKP